MTRENSRKQMVPRAHFWCGICGYFCASRSDCPCIKSTNTCKGRKQQKMNKIYSKDAFFLFKSADASDHAVHANACTHMGIH